MKKTLNYFLAAAIIMALGSCAKETEKINPSEKELIKASVRAKTAELNSETRTSLAENGDLYWSYEDEISVFDGTGNREFTADISATADPTKTASFVGVIDPDATSFVALYPYDKDATYSSGVVKTILPAAQEAVVGSFANNSNVAVATGDSSNMDGDEDYALCQFSFKNIGALVKFTISQANAHKSVSVKVKNSDGSFDNIAGAVEIVPATGIATVAATGGVDAVTVSAASGKLAAGDYYAIILPVTGEGKKISFVFSDGNATKTRTTKTAVTIARSSYLDMGTIDEGITYPETDPYLGNYIIVSKAASKDHWVVMKSGVDGSGRWAYDDTAIAFNEDVDLTNSSTDFATYSNAVHKFAVEAYDGGYVLLDVATGKYIQYNTGNTGKEVEPSQRVKFSTFSFNADGTVTIGMKNGSDTYSLQYNVGNYFTFYKSTQAPIYLIPYVGSATKSSISSISCVDNVVTISSVPYNAIIRYTIDGSDPTESSTLYTEPFSITETVTVKAKAFAPSTDYTDSDVASKECVWVNPEEHKYYVKVTSALQDWSGEYLFVYEADNVAFDGSLSTLDATGNTIAVTIENGKIERTTSVSASSFTVDAVTNGGYSIKSASGYYIGRAATTNGLNQSQNYGADYLNTFSYASNQVTIVAAGGKELAFNANAGQERFRYLSSANIAAYKLEEKREESGLAWSTNTGSIVLTTENDAIKETKNLPSLLNPNNVDVTYSSSKNYIASVDENGVITWKKAGETTIFATFAGDETYKPITVSYTLTVTDNRSNCATPSFNPVSGSVVALNSTVTISCSTSGAKVYYTTDGSDPTIESTEYTAPVTISNAMTLKAIAVNSPAYLNSEIASASYTIQKVANPVFSPAPGAVDANTNVSITCNTEGATIYYTTDGTNPTNASSVYSGEITITEAVTIKAIAMKSGYLNSGIVEANYTIKGAGPAVGATLWAETWTGSTTATSGSADVTPSANYGHGTTVYNNGTVTYTQSANTVYVRNENLAGGDKPELMLSSSQTWTISQIATHGATKLALTYKSNNTKSSVSCSTQGVTISGASKSYTISTNGAETITLVFNCSGNTRIDDVELKVTQ